MNDKPDAVAHVQRILGCGKPIAKRYIAVLGDSVTDHKDPQSLANAYVEKADRKDEPPRKPRHEAKPERSPPETPSTP